MYQKITERMRTWRQSMRTSLQRMIRPLHSLDLTHFLT